MEWNTYWLHLGRLECYSNLAFSATDEGLDEDVLLLKAIVGRWPPAASGAAARSVHANDCSIGNINI